MDGKKMANGKPKKKLPLLATGGAAIFTYNCYKDFNQGSPSDIGKLLWENFGVNHNGYAGSTVGPIKLTQMLKGLAPVIVGIGGSMAAAKLGANRYFSSIPFFKW